MIEPFSWDTSLIEWDRLIHFGVRPLGQLLQPLLGYALRHLLHQHSTITSGFSPDLDGLVLFRLSRQDASELRTRFFLAYLLIWCGWRRVACGFVFIGGPVLLWAGLAFRRIPIPGSWLISAESMSRVPIWAFRVQEVLWHGYTGQGRVSGFRPFLPCIMLRPCCLPLRLSQSSRVLGHFFLAYALYFYRLGPSGLALCGGQLLPGR